MEVFSFMIGIYKITSPSGKIYIGQSINIERRFSEHKKIKSKSQPRLYNSFKKHGVNNHFFEVVCECEISELNSKERYYQDFYDVIQKGLNCKLTLDCGKSGLISECTKNKMSIAQKGNKHWLGKKHSQTTKDKISLKSIGNKSMAGRTHSDETKKKMSIWQKGISKNNNRLGLKHLESTKVKLSKNRIGSLNPNAKIVLDMNTGVFFYSVIEVSKCFNINYETIKSKLNGKYKNNTNFKYV